MATTADIFQGTLPIGWVPTANVDPQDTAATTAFWNAGVQFPGAIRTQFQPLPVNMPVTFWKSGNPGFLLFDDQSVNLLTEDGGVFDLVSDGWAPNAFTLTGLGVSLGPKYLV